MGDKPEFIDLTEQLPKIEKIELTEQQKDKNMAMDLMRIKKSKISGSSQSSETSSR